MNANGELMLNSNGSGIVVIFADDLATAEQVYNALKISLYDQARIMVQSCFEQWGMNSTSVTYVGWESLCLMDVNATKTFRKKYTAVRTIDQTKQHKHIDDEGSPSCFAQSHAHHQSSFTCQLHGSRSTRFTRASVSCACVLYHSRSPHI